MEYVIKDYKPESLFRFFEEISAIPRGSGNEKKISEYVMNFAKERNLYCYTDDVHNVLIRKEATADCEAKAPLLLEGHLDMVCDKLAGTEHDFLKDPLELYVEDGFLKAKGTTLGADDGVAVAAMLAILDCDTISHPALECLFTTMEEAGMGGAKHFDYSLINSRRMISLDAGMGTCLVAGSAASIRAKYSLEAEKIPFENKSMKIQIRGLAGGHSGSDISKHKANSNILMGRILDNLYAACPFNLVSIDGGKAENVITRECDVVISVLDFEAAKETVLAFEKVIKAELAPCDKDFKVLVSKAPKPEKMMTYKTTTSLISILMLVPNGIYNMSHSFSNLVETSCNLGIVSTDETKINFVSFPRSNVESKLDEMIAKFERFAKQSGLRIEFFNRSPAWEYKSGTEMQKLYYETYKRLYPDQEQPELMVFHVGLECGIIKEKLGGDADIIGYTPLMLDIHTPDERLDLASFESFWNLLIELIKNVK